MRRSRRRVDLCRRHGAQVDLRRRHAAKYTPLGLIALDAVLGCRARRRAPTCRGGRRSDGTVYVLGRIFAGSARARGGSCAPTRRAVALRWKYLTPDWACGIAERPTDIAVQGDLVVVSGTSFGCCSDPFHDGWVQAFHRRLHPWWRADVEPPSPTPSAWFDTRDRVGIGPSGNVFVSGWAATRAIVDGDIADTGHTDPRQARGKRARVWSRARRRLGAIDVPARPARRERRRRGRSPGASTARASAWGSSPTTGLGGQLHGRRRPALAATVRRRPGDRRRADRARLRRAAGCGWKAPAGDPGNRGIDVFIRRYGREARCSASARIDPANKRLPVHAN